MKIRASFEKKSRTLPRSVATREEWSLPRMFLFLELFVGETPDFSSK